MSIVSPSILSASFSSIHEEVNKMALNGAKFIHLDVMDGKFVPNTTFDASLLDKIKDIDVIKDTHLMVVSPFKEIKEFAKAGSDIITIHVEAFSSNEEVYKAIELIKSLNVKPGISLKPNTRVEDVVPFLPLVGLVLVMSVEPGKGGQKFMPNSLEKISFFDEYRKKNNLDYLIEVDGGINLETAKLCVDKGVDVLVAGSYLYGHDDYKERLKGLIEL